MILQLIPVEAGYQPALLLERPPLYLHPHPLQEVYVLISCPTPVVVLQQLFRFLTTLVVNRYSHLFRRLGRRGQLQIVSAGSLTFRESSWVGCLETTRLMRSELGTSRRRVPPNFPPVSFLVDSRFNIVYTR